MYLVALRGQYRSTGTRSKGISLVLDQIIGIVVWHYYYYYNIL